MKVIDAYKITGQFIFKSLWTKYKNSFLFLKNIDDPKIYDTYYCILHSSNKSLISGLNSDTKEELISKLNDLSDIINIKYKTKWNKEYDLLELNDYNPLDDFNNIKVIEQSEVKKENNTFRSGETRSKQTNIRETNYDSVGESNYGFNSNDIPLSTPTNDEKSTSVNTTMGNSKENFVDVQHENNAVNNANNIINNTNNEHGINKHSYQELIKEEFEIRNNKFLDIICKDIDEIICLSIY